MTHHVDGFVIPPLKKNVGDYRRIARKARMIDSGKVALLKVADWILRAGCSSVVGTRLMVTVNRRIDRVRREEVLAELNRNPPNRRNWEKKTR